MAHVLADRVMETSTTTGTGAFTLAGAYTGYRRFSAVLSTNDTCRYCIAGVDGNGNDTGEWEVGLGTYSATSTLTRTTVESSSNGNTAVNFSAGTKRVFLGPSAAYFPATFLQVANDLADLHSPGTARTNLGLLRIIPFFFTTTPTSSEVLAIYVAVDGFTIAANMSGSQVKVGTNATATFAIDVQQNGSSIGTISIATNGTVTLTTTSGASKSVAAGDVIKFIAPSTTDATIANVAVNIKGTL
jgi:hypothetical protein